MHSSIARSNAALCATQGQLRVCGGREHHFGDRLSRDPGLDRAVAAGVADAEYLGRGMFGVGAGADGLLPLSQLGGTTALDVPIERGAVLELDDVSCRVELGDALPVARRVQGGCFECVLQLDRRD